MSFFILAPKIAICLRCEYRGLGEKWQGENKKQDGQDKQDGFDPYKGQKTKNKDLKHKKDKLKIP